jgi:two-component sensor histidine kinase
MARRVLSGPWSETALGPIGAWPAELRITAGLVLGSPQPMLLFWGPDLIQIYNDAFARTIGPERYPAALGASGRGGWDEVWPALEPQADAVLAGRGAVQVEDMRVPLTRFGQSQDAWWTYSCNPVHSGDGVGGVLMICNDVTDKHLAIQKTEERNRQLMEERDRQQQMFEQAPGFICVLRGPQHVFDLANRAYLKLVGATRDIIGLPLREAFPEMEGQDFFGLLDRVYASGQPFVGREVPVMVPGAGDGATQERLVDFIYQPIADAQGLTVGVFVEGSDVTERVQAQQRQSLLIRELHHRVRNTLATVQGIMGATARSSDSVAEFRDAFAGRIAAMAKTHALLTEHHWQKASFRELLRQELEPFDDASRQRILLDGPDIELPSEVAVPIGMAVHEMTTNAVKHGALSEARGSVEVHWTVTPVLGGSQLTWLWFERNGPAVMPPAREGFGTRLLNRVLAVQTKADVRVDFDAEGLKVVVILLVPDEPPEWTGRALGS